MALTHSHWYRYNKGHYVEMDKDHSEIFLVDLINELETGDFLNTCVATTTSSGLAIESFFVRIDTTQQTQPHQQAVLMKPTALGAHDVKLISTTENGYTIVKHFDVLCRK